MVAQPFLHENGLNIGWHLFTLLPSLAAIWGSTPLFHVQWCFNVPHDCDGLEHVALARNKRYVGCFKQVKSQQWLYVKHARLYNNDGWLFLNYIYRPLQYAYCYKWFKSWMEEAVCIGMKLSWVWINHNYYYTCACAQVEFAVGFYSYDQRLI